MSDRLGDQLHGARLGGLIHRTGVPLGQSIRKRSQAGRISDFLGSRDVDQGGHFALKALRENHLAAEWPAFIENNQGRALFEPGLRRPAHAFDQGAGRIHEFGVAAAHSFLKQRSVSIIDGGSIFLCR
jgi:hypothetical protein